MNGLFLGLFALVLPVSAATLSVTNDVDGGEGSLRLVLAKAATGDRIIIESLGPVVLTSPMLISKDVSIEGSRPPGYRLTYSSTNFPIAISSTVTFSNLIFSGCSLTNSGVITNSGNLVLSACLFESNKCLNVNGGIITSTGPLSVENCSFFGNSATGKPAGAYTNGPDVHGAALTQYGANCSVSNCQFTENSSTGGTLYAAYQFGNMSYVPGGSVLGSAISISNGSLNVTNSRFQSNRAIGASFQSAALGGAVYGSSSSIAISSCSFRGNVAKGGDGFFSWASLAGNAFGGAIYLTNSNAGIENSDFEENAAFAGAHGASADDLFSSGGAIFNMGPPLHVATNVFANNIASTALDTAGPVTSAGGNQLLFPGGSTGFIQSDTLPLPRVFDSLAHFEWAKTIPFVPHRIFPLDDGSASVIGIDIGLTNLLAISIGAEAKLGQLESWAQLGDPSFYVLGITNDQKGVHFYIDLNLIDKGVRYNGVTIRTLRLENGITSYERLADSIPTLVSSRDTFMSFSSNSTNSFAEISRGTNLFRLLIPVPSYWEMGAIDDEGNCYLSGYVRSPWQFPGTASTITSTFLIKLNRANELVWLKTDDSMVSRELVATANGLLVQESTPNGVVLCRYHSSNTPEVSRVLSSPRSKFGIEGGIILHDRNRNQTYLLTARPIDNFPAVSAACPWDADSAFEYPDEVLIYNLSDSLKVNWTTRIFHTRLVWHFEYAPFDAALDRDGNILVVGTMHSPVSFASDLYFNENGPAGYTGFVAKLLVPKPSLSITPALDGSAAQVQWPNLPGFTLQRMNSNSWETVSFSQSGPGQSAYSAPLTNSTSFFRLVRDPLE